VLGSRRLDPSRPAPSSGRSCLHLDEVEQLGTFIELEAVAPADSDLDHEHRLIVKLRDALRITDERLVALGYAAQLLRASSDPKAS
jgi:adenylate cyclase, class 2